MKFSNLFLILAFAVFAVSVESMAQNSQPKPKITSKSVSAPVKTSVPVRTSTPVRSSTPVRQSAPPSRSAKITFENLLLDLGTIKEDAVVEKSFEFTNTGGTDLVVIDAKGSCGCTVPIIPTYPIPPGGKGKILVKYTAKNKVGPQKPVITVTTNGVPSVVKLNMETWVEQIPGGVKD
jgi:hypothetical protein